MNTPENVFKLQTRLSEACGTKKISEWLTLVALLLLVWATVDAVLSKENLLRAMSGPLGLPALFSHMWIAAKRRAADLERALAS